MEEKTAKISRIICKIYNVFVHGDEVTLWKAQMTEMLDCKHV
jgi:hypothetical protein